MEDVEFRLGRGYRTRALVQGCVALAITAGLFAAGLHMPALQWLAIFPLAFAAGSVAVCGWRGHLSTRLTAQGIEIRRYRRRLVPWQAIADVETVSPEHVADVPVTDVRGRIVSPRGRGPNTVAAVWIVRSSGHRNNCPPRWLPTPRTTRTSLTRYS